MTAKTDISIMSDNDLLADLGDRAVRPESVVELWIKLRGYRPGDTRTKASDLLKRFNDWQATNGHPRTNPNTWGAEMARHFRSSRTSYGKFYYISQLADDEISLG